jgi:hypothetical protein
MLQLKLVKLPEFFATETVNLAGTTEPFCKVLPSLSQVKVNIVLAIDGVQFEVVMESVSAVLPVFFM